MIRDLAFVELTVADWPASVAWYRDRLGLEILLQVEKDQFALLRAGTGRIALKAGRPQSGTVLVTFEVDDLPGELEKLAGFGITPAEPMKDGEEGYRRVILHDPNGYRLCLFDWRQPPE